MCKKCRLSNILSIYVLHKTQNMWILTSNILQGMKGDEKYLSAVIRFLNAQMYKN